MQENRRGGISGADLRNAVSGAAGTMESNLSRIHKDERLAAVLSAEAKFDDGETILHSAVRKDQPMVLAILNNLVNPGDCLTAIAAQDKQDNTVLHAAIIATPNILQIIIDTILKAKDESQKRTVFNQKNKSGHTALHMAVVYDRESVKELFKMYQTIYENGEGRLDVLTGQDNNGDTMLHTCFNENTVKMILNAFPDEAKLKAINIKNKQDLTVLHQIISSRNNIEVVTAILTNLPKEARLAAINEKDKNGDTVLHRAINEGKKETVEAILKTLPNNAWPLALCETNAKNKSVLDLAKKKNIFKFPEDFNKSDVENVESYIKIILPVKKQVERYQAHLLKKPTDSHSITKLKELDEIQKLTLGNPALNNKERIPQFAEKYDGYMKKYLPKANKEEKAKMHLLASFGTFGIYAGVRAIYSAVMRGSPKFWQSHKEIVKGKTEEAVKKALKK